LNYQDKSKIEPFKTHTNVKNNNDFTIENTSSLKANLLNNCQKKKQMGYLNFNFNLNKELPKKEIRKRNISEIQKANNAANLILKNEKSSKTKFTPLSKIENFKLSREDFYGTMTFKDCKKEGLSNERSKRIIENCLTPDRKKSPNLYHKESITIMDKIPDIYNNCFLCEKRDKSCRQLSSNFSPKILIQLKDQTFEKLFQLMNSKKTNFINKWNLNLQSIFY